MEEWKINVLYFILGTAFGAIGFLLTYRSAWRNLITGEFKVRISPWLARTEGFDLTQYSIKVEFICSDSEEIQLIEMFFEFNKRGQGLAPQGQLIRGKDYYNINNYLWKSGQDADSLSFTKYHNFNHKLGQGMLAQVNTRTIRWIRLVVRTNKYGVVKSKKLKIKHPESPGFWNDILTRYYSR